VAVKTLPQERPRQGYLGSQEQYYWDSLIVLACSANVSAHRLSGQARLSRRPLIVAPSGPVEVGVSFKSDTSGTISAIRFYKSTANTGLHVGPPLSGTGALLATVTFAGESSRVGQQATFSTQWLSSEHRVRSFLPECERALERQLDYFATSGVNSPPFACPAKRQRRPDGLWGSAGASPRIATHRILGGRSFQRASVNPLIATGGICLQ